MAVQIPLDQARIADFCRRHHIRKLALFGSVLRQDFSAESDVDVLVELEPNHVPGYIRLAGMEIELGGIIGRRVDMRTAQELSRYIRQAVVDSAEAVYVSG